MITKDTKGVLPIEGDITGKVVIIPSDRLGKLYQQERYQLWTAKSGFGCQDYTRGNAVIATCLGDDETARYERYDFIGIASDELVAEVMEKYKDVPNVRGEDFHEPAPVNVFIVISSSHGWGMAQGNLFEAIRNAGCCEQPFNNDMHITLVITDQPHLVHVTGLGGISYPNKATIIYLTERERPVKVKELVSDREMARYMKDVLTDFERKQTDKLARGLDQLEFAFKDSDGKAYDIDEELDNYES